MLPARVERRRRIALECSFDQSSDDDVGRLLAVLAATVRSHGRILEIGTGAGVGLAWLVEGLVGRDDVNVVSIDVDADLVARVAGDDWPPFVSFETGDALELVPSLGRFDLVFADAVAGKWYGLDVTIDATAEDGTIVVDDMIPSRWLDEEHERRTAEVRSRLLSDQRLVAVELPWATGLLVATRRTRRVTHDDLERVLAYERELLDPAVRRSVAALERLLDPEFTEIGATGRAWNRAHVVASLVASPQIADVLVGDMAAGYITADVAFVEYMTSSPTREVRRTLWWRRAGDGEWRCVHHQGTLVAGR